jgi:hypothetical protein
LVDLGELSVDVETLLDQLELTDRRCFLGDPPLDPGAPRPQSRQVGSARVGFGSPLRSFCRAIRLTPRPSLSPVLDRTIEAPGPGRPRGSTDLTPRAPRHSCQRPAARRRSPRCRRFALPATRHRVSRNATARPKNMNTIEIPVADVLGVPLVVRCSRCGAEWFRPLDDPNAGTLPRWAVLHACPGYLH